MKRILVIGSTGQIGSELTRELRKAYGNDNVVAGYIKGAEPKGWLAESGPSAEADVTNPQMIADVVKNNSIDTIYNLAAWTGDGTSLRWHACMAVLCSRQAASALLGSQHQR